jgi:outer membrane protein assembly factor BamB
MPRLGSHRALPLALLLSILVVSATAASAQGTYSEGGWATLHRSGANRRNAGAVPLSDRYATWHALEGAAVLTAPTLSPDGQTLYVTTGREAGQSNLHAFRIDGEVLWRASPWQNASRGIDPCAVLSSPIVDREGDVYLSDCNQLFAFHADGSIKWIVPLPPPQPEDWQPSTTLPINAFTTALFTRDGHVAGITNFGDVVVVDRETGDSLALPYRLPGLLPPASTAVPMAESVFGEGLMAPEIREWAWQLLFGGHMRSANTPAVDQATGRIFVAASSPNEGRGALYALDLVATNPATRAATGAKLEVRIAHATDIGLGSGSSPALSPEADRVYVSDETGIFYAIDARNGAIVWQVPTRSTAAAAAVGGDGTIYSLQAGGPALVAISPEGRIQWQSDLSRLTTQALPPSWLLGDPVAVGNGNPTALDGFVLLPVIYGYETTLGRRIPWPVLSTVVAIDSRTGEGVANVVALPDDSTGITVALPDGTLIHSLGTAITSALRPLSTVAGWLLPGDLEPLEPVGGLQVSRPETMP